MIDKFVNSLNSLVIQGMISGLDIKNDLENEDSDTRDYVAKNNFICIKVLNDIITGLLFDLEREEREKKIKEQEQKPYKKFMFVEDGSVDVDNLIEEMEVKHPEIKVVVYRQGANKPEFLDLGENK